MPIFGGQPPRRMTFGGSPPCGAAGAAGAAGGAAGSGGGSLRPQWPWSSVILTSRAATIDSVMSSHALKFARGTPASSKSESGTLLNHIIVQSSPDASLLYSSVSASK